MSEKNEAENSNGERDIVENKKLRYGRALTVGITVGLFVG
jgi:hypothetical protein